MAQQRRRDPPRWMWINIANGARLMGNPHMTRTCWRVLGALIAHIQWTSDCHITLAQLCQATGLQQPHVSSALQRLEAIGVIDRFTKGQYHLNATYLYVGGLDSELHDRQGVDSARRRRQRTHHHHPMVRGGL